MARKASQKKKGGTAKYGRNKIKCEEYRRRVGKPRGPGVAGNKAGKNR
jgi:hypothetical protein